jgi:4-diphosphocytidyl-2-C-methyl-D-erythritol kinase
LKSTWREIAPAKLNLALHVRGRLADGRHAIETIFAFCTDGDRLKGELSECIGLTIEGPFGGELGDAEDNLVTKAARALAKSASVEKGAALVLDKRLPVASGIGGGSADAAAALRLLTSLWGIAPSHALEVAGKLGSDVPACLLSLPMRGEGAGDRLSSIDFAGVSGTPVLLVNPCKELSTAEVFASWNGHDSGPLENWRDGHNDLEAPAIKLVPEIATILEWLREQAGVTFVRMSGSGATCFGLFATEEERDRAADAVPAEWWRLSSFLR